MATKYYDAKFLAKESGFKWYIYSYPNDHAFHLKDTLVVSEKLFPMEAEVLTDCKQYAHDNYDHDDRPIFEWDRYYIYDAINCGFAIYNPLEGWIFTILRENAARFDTVKEAAEVIEKQYPKDRDRLLVRCFTTY